MPAIFYGTRCRKPIHIELYRIAISNQASIHAMAAYASKSLDFLYYSKASQLTLNHTMRALKRVNEVLLTTHQFQDDRDDGVILAIAMLAFAEVGSHLSHVLTQSRVVNGTVIAPFWSERRCTTALDWLEGSDQIQRRFRRYSLQPFVKGDTGMVSLKATF